MFTCLHVIRREVVKRPTQTANLPVTARVNISQNVDIHVYTCQGITSALKSRTLSNLTWSKYIQVKLVDKALSCIVQGGQNDSKNQIYILWFYIHVCTCISVMNVLYIGSVLA